VIQYRTFLVYGPSENKKIVSDVCFLDFFQFCISILHQKKRTDVSFETCSRFPENERTFCIKRAHVLSGTNGRLGTDAVKVPVNDDSDRNITLKFEDL